MSAIDLRVLRISDHAATRFCERVSGITATRGRRSRAKARIVVRLRSAELLESGNAHDGTPQRLWKLADCVAVEKAGTVTTILTFEQHANGIRSDETT